MLGQQSIQLQVMQAYRMPHAVHFKCWTCALG